LQVVARCQKVVTQAHLLKSVENLVVVAESTLRVQATSLQTRIERRLVSAANGTFSLWGSLADLMSSH